jgi:hypothetical protein
MSVVRTKLPYHPPKFSAHSEIVAAATNSDEAEAIRKLRRVNSRLLWRFATNKASSKVKLDMLGRMKEAARRLEVCVTFVCASALLCSPLLCCLCCLR